MNMINTQQLLNEAEQDVKNYADRSGCYVPRLKTLIAPPTLPPPQNNNNSSSTGAYHIWVIGKKAAWARPSSSRQAVYSRVN